MLDPLGFVTKTRQILEDEGKREIEAAPQTMLQNDQTEYKTSVNYFYSPTLEEVPQLDMPLDLPDLPGIITKFLFNLSRNVQKSLIND